MQGELASPAAAPPAAKPQEVAARKRSIASAFGADVEEDQPRRKLIPLQYTAEELKAAKAANAAAAGAAPLVHHRLLMAVRDRGRFVK